MAKRKILVVLGGNSREREISIKTGKACIAAIKRLGYKVEKFDPKKRSFFDIKKSKSDIIFNALHGEEGEDGYAQSFFEYSKIPYTHSGVISSMNAMNKLISKKIFIKNKIKTPIFNVIKKEDYNLSKFKQIKKIKGFKFPLVIKPNNEGSSIGVKICKNSIMLKRSIKSLLKTYDTLIIENFIGGQEIQVAVLNGKVLGAIELKPKREFYDYKAKYLKSARTNHIMPTNISQKIQKFLQIAEKTHKILGCRGVTRSDFKFFNNKFYLLETNTQPGMTDLSLVPEIASYKKINFDKLVQKIILDASLNK